MGFEEEKRGFGDARPGECKEDGVSGALNRHGRGRMINPKTCRNPREDDEQDRVCLSFL